MDNTDQRRWKVLDSQYLHTEPWLTIRRDHVELPNGSQIPSYYVHEYPEWINVIAITPEDRFVMVRQYRHARGITAYELCAGVCEDNGESIMDAAKRELLEETGYGGGTWEEFMTISMNPSTHTNLTHCFLAKGVEPIAEQHLEDSEDLTVHLLSYDEVKELLMHDQIVQALHAAPLWKYVSAREGARR